MKHRLLTDDLRPWQRNFVLDLHPSKKVPRTAWDWGLLLTQNVVCWFSIFILSYPTLTGQTLPLPLRNLGNTAVTIYLSVVVFILCLSLLASLGLVLSKGDHQPDARYKAYVSLLDTLQGYYERPGALLRKGYSVLLNVSLLLALAVAGKTAWVLVDLVATGAGLFLLESLRQLHHGILKGLTPEDVLHWQPRYEQEKGIDREDSILPAFEAQLELGYLHLKGKPGA